MIDNKKTKKVMFWEDGKLIQTQNLNYHWNRENQKCNRELHNVELQTDSLPSLTILHKNKVANSNSDMFIVHSKEIDNLSLESNTQIIQSPNQISEIDISVKLSTEDDIFKEFKDVFDSKSDSEIWEILMSCLNERKVNLAFNKAVEHGILLKDFSSQTKKNKKKMNGRKRKRQRERDQLKKENLLMSNKIKKIEYQNNWELNRFLKDMKTIKKTKEKLIEVFPLISNYINGFIENPTLIGIENILIVLWNQVKVTKDKDIYHLVYTDKNIDILNEDFFILKQMQLFTGLRNYL